MKIMKMLSFFTVSLCLSSLCFANGATLYDQLSALPNATTFKGLIDKAGLQSMLQTGGPLTLVVPTDASFAKLSASDLSAATANQQALLNVLNYHMFNGSRNTHSFLFGRHYHINSTNGHIIRVYRSSTGTHFNQAKVLTPDISASNGVIHLINTVLDVPEGTIIDILGNSAYNLSKFLDIVKKAHLTDNYANPLGLNRYTVFAPSNAAVSELSQATLDKLSKDYTYLRMLIEYHVHSGTMHSYTLAKRHYVSTTLPAHNISVTTATDGSVMLNNVASVVLNDIEAENGVVHIISKVLIPQILNPIVG